MKFNRQLSVRAINVCLGNAPFDLEHLVVTDFLGHDRLPLLPDHFAAVCILSQNGSLAKFHCGERPAGFLVCSGRMHAVRSTKPDQSGYSLKCRTD
jgi:hypothetical protein